MWGEPWLTHMSAKSNMISTHSPRVGRTTRTLRSRHNHPHFNSLAPCGANLDIYGNFQPLLHFNSLAPCGANLPSNVISNGAFSFQLTRPVWGEPRRRTMKLKLPKISTHSPRVGRTLCHGFDLFPGKNFNSLAPCGANLEAYTDLILP